MIPGRLLAMIEADFDEINWQIALVFAITCSKGCRFAILLLYIA
jgi:hypothetical protein